MKESWYRLVLRDGSLSLPEPLRLFSPESRLWRGWSMSWYGHILARVAHVLRTAEISITAAVGTSVTLMVMSHEDLGGHYQLGPFIKIKGPCCHSARILYRSLHWDQAVITVLMVCLPYLYCSMCRLQARELQSQSSASGSENSRPVNYPFNLMLVFMQELCADHIETLQMP